jgi:hypothetical protein
LSDYFLIAEYTVGIGVFILFLKLMSIKVLRVLKNRQGNVVRSTIIRKSFTRLLTPQSAERDLSKGSQSANQTILFFALLAIVGQFMLTHAVARSINPGFASNHVFVAGVGTSIIVGVALHNCYLHVLNTFPYVGKTIVAIVGALITGVALALGSGNVDIHETATNGQRNFWAAFSQRFPTLPPDSFWVFDVDDYAYPNVFGIYDLNSWYDLEFPLNLFSFEADSAKFRRHTAATIRGVTPLRKRDDDSVSGWENPGKKWIFRREDAFGKEEFDLRKAIFVHYRNGILSVNNEINFFDKVDPKPFVFPGLNLDKYKLLTRKPPPLLKEGLPRYRYSHATLFGSHKPYRYLRQHQLTD